MTPVRASTEERRRQVQAWDDVMRELHDLKDNNAGLERANMVAVSLLLEATDWIRDHHSDDCPTHDGRTCRCGVDAFANRLEQELAQA